MNFDYALYEAQEELARQYLQTRGSPARWRVIRKAYELQLPHIMAARKKRPLGKISPYFVDWDFTPIEAYAWCDIRELGLPLYPQYPVGRYFIDFADPYLKIGVELDGAAYHSVEQDEPRDADLWSQGWRIFRIPGCDSLPSNSRPFNDMCSEEERNYPDYAQQTAATWIQDKSEGFFWALKMFYYMREPFAQRHIDAIYKALSVRRLIEFPLEIESGADNESP